MACSSCGKKISENLGKCKTCIILSFTLSIVSWLIIIYALPLLNQTLSKYLTILLTIWALLFSLLFIAHMFAYLNDRFKTLK